MASTSTTLPASLPSAPPQFHHLWEEAVAGLKTSLDATEFAKVSAINSIDDLLSEVKGLEVKYKKQIFSRLLKRCDPFFQELGRFTNVVNIFAQSNPEISALVWGSIYFVLDVAARHREYLENVVKMFELVERHMPRLRTYAELFTNATRIEKAVLGLYQELTRFCLNAIRHLKRKSIINILSFTFPGKSYQLEFNRTLDSIRDHSNWIDTEAFVTFHQTSLEIGTRRHEEIMRNFSSPTPAEVTDLPEEPENVKYQLIPWPENPQFFGRDDELRALSDALPDTNCDRLSIFSIIGMGGVGKSQLALRHLYAHLDSLDAVFWVAADTRAKIAEGYAKIAKEVGLVAEGSQLPQLDVICESIKRWFKNTTKSWLLVLDNVSSLESLDGYLPIGARGRLIITSRNITTSQPPTTASILLKPFGPEDGASFLLSMLPLEIRNESRANDEAMSISITCGGLALALSQGARFLSTVNISIADLSRLCATTSAFVYPRSTLNSAPNDYYYSGTVSTAWDKPLHLLPPASSFLAKLLVFFDKDNISEAMLRSGARVAVPLAGHIKDEAEFYESIGILFSHLLISKTNASGGYVVHPLVQATIGMRMGSEEKTSLFNIALEIIDDGFPKHEPFVAEWDTCILFLPHAIRLGMLYREAGIHLEFPRLLQLGKLLERGAWYLQERGQPEQASVILLDVEKIAEEGSLMLSQNTVDGATSELEDEIKELHSDVLNQQGNIEFEFYNFQKALEWFTRSFDMKRSMHKPDENEVCYLIRNIGSAYMKLQNIPKAHELFLESLALREKQLVSVPNPEAYKYELANNYGSLSVCLYHEKNYDRAIETASYSMELVKQMYGDENIHIARCYFNIGNTRCAQGRIHDAEQLYLKAIEIWTTKLGEHWTTALCLHRYAMLLHSQGRLEEAISTIQLGIATLRKFPKVSIALARSLLFMAIISKTTMGVETQAAREEALAIYYSHVKYAENAREVDAILKHLDDLVSD